MFFLNAYRWQAKLIDGKLIAKQIKDEVKIEVDSLIASGKRAPRLAAVQVGEDPASATYIRNKMKATEAVGKLSGFILSLGL